ncbi:hypothetical protein CAOG_04920 [Capsaspora owczarzaki ATCC 30864]|uniref:hypothetical protein n=1 Tax=Capsaspora owczarzaki (strain ATCC 30864) TaxID=595528 RepID=UPI00035238F3|nr:hypothetical protein CAOG_04920 [Capsaspora owczarzaki ATCC 30864]|eukprot:XP_004347671.2 hypothetical protein CAOG_04920 [Capsaspora owczarzaki ATCC 30864]
MDPFALLMQSGPAKAATVADLFDPIAQATAAATSSNASAPAAAAAAPAATAGSGTTSAKLTSNPIAAPTALASPAPSAAAAAAPAGVSVSGAATPVAAVAADAGNSDAYSPFTGSSFNFPDFLEKMKQPSSYELVKSIKVFITSFLERPYNADEQTEMVQLFMQNTARKLVVHPLWKGASPEALDNAIEGLEKYLMHKLYAAAFSNPTSSDVYLDECLDIRIRRLSFLTPAHLDIKPGRITDANLGPMMAELQRMNSYKAPRDKLICILNCCKTIYNVLQNAEGAAAGADEFLPILIYVVLRANPVKLHSDLQYIQRFRHPDKLTSEPMYYFTNLVSAVAFIQQVTSAQLSIDPAVFDAEMAKTAHLEPKSLPPKPRAAPTPAPAAAAPAPSTNTLSSSTSVLPLQSQLQPSASAPAMTAMQQQKRPAAAAASTTAASASSSRPSSQAGASSSFASAGPADGLQNAPSVDIDMFLSADCKGPPNKKFLVTKFDALTIADLVGLYNDYRRLARQNQELAQTLYLNLGVQPPTREQPQ